MTLTVPFPPDAALLNVVADQKDATAFQQLSSRHTDWIYSMSLRLTKNPAFAEDVTQGVLLVLWQKAETLQHHPSLISWLFRATRYGASALLRAERRRKNYEGGVMPAVFLQDTVGSEEFVEIQARLDRAVGKLSDADRRAILLRFYQQQTHPEIAAELNISEEAARKRVNRAVERVRGLLGLKSAAILSAALTTSLVISAPKNLSAAVATSQRGTVLSNQIRSAFVVANFQWWAALGMAVVIPTVIVGTLWAHNAGLSASGGPAVKVTTPVPVVSASAPAMPNDGFSPVVECTLIGRDEVAAEGPDQPTAYFSLEARKSFIKPSTIDPKNASAMLRWIRMNNIDLLGDRQVSNGIPFGGLLGVYVAAIPAKASDWDRIGAADLQNNAALAKAAPSFPATLSPTIHDRKGNFRDEVPTTWLFKTKAGNLGILQITDVVNRHPTGVKVRYKLVQ